MTNARQLTPGLIHFLYQPHIVQSMREMSDLGRPAVEGVGALLLDHFGDSVSEDPVKQRIGKIVKGVMESNGYIHDSYGHKTPGCPLFTSGSLYSRR